ncbi:MAG: hypothetical protein FE78DRAFT_83932, partial [Acidomyces sp. 'richmondensis']
LKDSVKDELIRDGRTNKDLDELIRTAIDLYNKLYERNIERRHDTRVRGSAGYVKKGSDKKGKNNPIKKREGLKCYTYSKTGYIAKNYRSKNKV